MSSTLLIAITLQLHWEDAKDMNVWWEREEGAYSSSTVVGSQ